MMSESELRIWLARIMAEVLRVQRWAGGDSVSAARVFGLQHGFETTVREESIPAVSEMIQDKVEDLLADVQAGKQKTDGLSIKDRLLQDGVDEEAARLVMEQCRLESRFPDEVVRILGNVRRGLPRKTGSG